MKLLFFLFSSIFFIKSQEYTTVPTVADHISNLIEEYGDENSLDVRSNVNRLQALICLCSLCKMVKSTRGDLVTHEFKVESTSWVNNSLISVYCRDESKRQKILNILFIIRSKIISKDYKKAVQLLDNLVSYCNKKTEQPFGNQVNFNLLSVRKLIVRKYNFPPDLSNIILGYLQLSDGKLEPFLKIEINQPISVAWSSDSRYIAILDYVYELKVFDLKKEELLRWNGLGINEVGKNWNNISNLVDRINFCRCRDSWKFPTPKDMSYYYSMLDRSISCGYCIWSPDRKYGINRLDEHTLEIRVVPFLL